MSEAVSLPEDLRALATQMRAVATRIEIRARARDRSGEWRDVYQELRHADEMRGAAGLCDEWAQKIEREDATHEAR